MGSWFKKILLNNLKQLVSKSAIIMSPYLQGVSTRNIFVMVESKNPTPVAIEYGENTIYNRMAKTRNIEITTATPETYVHRILLDNLKSNTRYYYRIKGSLENYSFYTAADPGTNFRFAWMADFRSGVKVHDQIASLIKEAQPKVSFYGGDISLYSNYKSYKKNFFRPPQLKLIANVPFFNATGNHEGWSINTRAFTQAPIYSSNQGYYSVDYGDLHTLVLNTEIDFNPGSPQYEFVKKDLYSTTRRWKMVTCHIPAYSAGGHGENDKMILMSTNLFEPNKVDLVLSGHSHFYQHNYIHNVHHLIIGSAGAPLHTPESASYTIKSVKDYNFAIVDVTPFAMQITVYNNKKQMLDRLSIRKTFL